MKALQYPFDADLIISKKKKLRRELLADGTFRIKKNIAILGGSTTNDIKLVLELFLLNYGIEPVFYESEYNQYYQEAIFPNDKLESFKPDVIYICTTNRNVTIYPDLSMDEKDIAKLLDEEEQRFTSIWASLHQRYCCPIIQNNFEMPSVRLMGNKDISDIHGKSNFINRLNMRFYEYAQIHDNFYICDINYISADYGLSKWSEPSYWYMYKYALNVSAIPYLSYNVANIIKSLFGKNKKGFVVDLDNTLWGGVIAEDGVEQIHLGKEEAEGEAFLAFQEYIKSYKQLGVVFNINSKNDLENAIAGLKHPDSVLHPEDFVVIKANWEEKDKNFLEIAEEMDILPESLVFLDDNPAERYIVTEQIKGVNAPELDQVADYIALIDHCAFFETTVLSQDDMNRNKMYKENIERKVMETKYKDYNDFLRSLNMKTEIKRFDSMHLPRIVQLINKSNQFNLTTKRYTQNEIKKIAESEEYITLYGNLNDRFGENGIVSIIIGHIEGRECHIDLWIMSCRVLKRGLEYAMLDYLVEVCRKKDLQSIIGYYYPTTKNSMVQNFYMQQGFICVKEDSNGNSKWILKDLLSYEKKNKVIQLGGN